MLVTNLTQQSIINQWLLYDTINYLDTESDDFKISNDLLKICKLAHSGYAQALEKQKEDQVVDKIQEETTEIK